MKTAAIAFIFLTLPALCAADTFVLKDGTRLEGAITGEMDGAVLIKTAYGSLTISRADITQQVPAAPAAAETSAAAPSEAPAPAAPPEASTAPAAPPEASTAPAAETPAPAEPAAAEAPAPAELPPGLTFAALPGENGNRLVAYYSGGVAVATETYDAGGALLSLEGAIKNGTYSEYYPDGKLKSVKTMLGGKVNGTVKAFYPSGVPQIEAYFLDGARDGDFKYFGEDGKPLMTAVYKADRLHGWKREYAPGGALTSELFYQDDKPAEPPKPADAQAKPSGQGEDSLVTAKVKRIARGEIFSFKLGGKYIGKTRVDREFNVIEQDGDVPDGTVKVYGKDGKLQKELVFKKGELKVLRAYGEDGRLSGVYTYKEGRALSFAVK